MIEPCNFHIYENGQISCIKCLSFFWPCPQKGSYLDSCYECDYNADEPSLSCYCKPPSGSANPIKSVVTGGCDYYINNNGKLECSLSSSTELSSRTISFRWMYKLC